MQIADSTRTNRPHSRCRRGVARQRSEPITHSIHPRNVHKVRPNAENNFRNVHKVRPNTPIPKSPKSPNPQIKKSPDYIIKIFF